MKKRGRPPSKIDMSPAAIDQRLREVSELRRLCLSLGRARPVGPIRRRPG